MINIFEVFLPQLLRYPNPNDPLNGEAAALMMRHPKEYEAKVKGKIVSSYRCQNVMFIPAQSTYSVSQRRILWMPQKTEMKTKQTRR
jgi:hypothetical protein